MSGATFAYQWVSSDGTEDSDIAGTTSATYTLVDADAGNSIRVRVSFTDDAGFRETLTSTATALVQATTPSAPRSLSVSRGGRGELVASWQAPLSDGGSNITSYKVQWKSGTQDYDAIRQAVVTNLSRLSYTITGLTGDIEHSVRIIALNGAGAGTPSAEVYATPTTAPTAPVDDHGDSTESATDLPLNTSVAGIINSSDDEDFFRMQLSGFTFLVIAQLGLNDTFAQRHRKMTLLNSDGTSVATNATHRIRLGAGTYYLKVFNTAHDGNTERYNIRAKTVADHGSTTGTATTLSLIDPDEARTTPVWLRVNGDFHSASDVDVFKVVLSAATDVTVRIGTSTTLLVHSVGSVTPVKLELLDGSGTPVRPSVEDTALLFGRTYSLDAGTHYFRLSPYTNILSNTYLIPYTIQATD